ncbi:hypothetical protein ACQKWADRAFT_307269, partial [Trichoderma austrokoningii]
MFSLNFFGLVHTLFLPFFWESLLLAGSHDSFFSSRAEVFRWPRWERRRGSSLGVFTSFHTFMFFAVLIQEFCLHC